MDVFKYTLIYNMYGNNIFSVDFFFPLYVASFLPLIQYYYFGVVC